MSYRHTIKAGLENLREIEQMLAEFTEKESIPAVEIDLVLQKTRNFYEIMLMLRQHQLELMRSQSEDHAPPEDAAGAVVQGKPPDTATGSGMEKGPLAAAPGSRPEEEPLTNSAGSGAEEEPLATAGKVSVKEEATPPAKSGTDEEKTRHAAGSDESGVTSEVSPGEGSKGSEVPLEVNVKKPDRPSDDATSKQGKEAAILSDRFSGRSSLYDSIHETVSQRDGGPIGQVKPVSSIKSVIGINDRFTYIRELFNNDAAAFDSTIGILDDAANFNEAYNYMIQRFDWDMDSDVVQQLLDIIRRKYITGRHE